MIAAFNRPRRRTDVQFVFDYKGIPIEVQARVRPDGTLASGADYFARTGNGRQLVFSTTRQIGTLEDAVAEFIAAQESQTPDQVYADDPDRVPVGNDLRNQIRRMNEADPMVTTGRMGFRYKTPIDQEYDL